jgi:ribosomal protein S25
MDKIVSYVIKEDYITASFIQRKLGIAYISAQIVLKKLSEAGYIEDYKPFKKLKVIKHHFIQ